VGVLAGGNQELVVDIPHVESAAVRAAQQFGATASVGRATDGLELTPLSAAVAEDAAWIRGQGGVELADAIHLASALRVSEELSATVIYDRRLAAAAREAGLEVAAPGQLAAP